MKKIKLISILILIVTLVYFTWNHIEFKNLQTNTTEKENISQLAIKTIESLHLGNVEFLNSLSETDKVKTILFARMEMLKKYKYSDIEVMDIIAEKRNMYSVVALFSNDIYNYLEYTFIFKKINNKWMIVNLHIE